MGMKVQKEGSRRKRVLRKRKRQLQRQLGLSSAVSCSASLRSIISWTVRITLEAYPAGSSTDRWAGVGPGWQGRA